MSGGIIISLSNLEELLEQGLDFEIIYPVMDDKTFEETAFSPEEARILEDCDGDNSILDLLNNFDLDKEQLITILLKYERRGLLRIYRERPEILEPMECETYLNKVKNNLMLEKIDVEFDYNSFPEIIGMKFKRELLVYMYIIIGVGHANTVTSDTIREFTTKIESIAKDRILEKSNIFTIALLCSSDVSERAKVWVKSAPLEILYEGIITLPAVFDLKNQELSFNSKKVSYQAAHTYSI